ncbi:MAG: glycosyltransferase family 2 protein [Cytophagales bacterium]|nr:glycosyltransferase family 2 protein [Cytophagales bacterium]
MTPIVSVIIPNYNHSNYLPERIESVLNQTYDHFEVILLDDCSPDNSAEILYKYQNHPKVSHIIINTENSGSTFIQWNKGISIAKGQYIWIAESDDFSDKHFLETCMDTFEEDPTLGIVYCNSVIVDSEGEKIKLFYPNQVSNSQRWEKKHSNLGIDEVKNHFLNRNIIPNASSCVFKKKLVTTQDLAIEKYKVCGDWLFWAKLTFKSSICYVPNPYNYFRTHTNNVRTKTKNRGLNILEIFDVQFQLVELLQLNLQERKNLSNQMLHRWAHTHFNVTPFDWSRKKELYSLCKKVYEHITISLVKTFIIVFLRKYNILK